MSWKLADHVSLTDTGAGAVLLNERDGRYWQINGTGALVLRALAHGREIDEVVRQLCDAHPDAAGDVEADVRRVVDRAEAAGLVRREP